MAFDHPAGDAVAALRRAAVPFVAGAGAATALAHGLYASALLGLLIALWAAALMQQRVARQAAPPPPPPAPVAEDADERRRLRQYLDLSPAPLVTLDDRDRMRALNRAARRLFAADDLVPDPPAALIATIAATVPGRAATVRVDAGGDAPVFALLTADLHGTGDTVRVAALVDIDADLKAAEAATLRDLVQVLGHEIGNSLTPIASLSATAAAMLAEPQPDLTAVREAIGAVARRAAGLQRFGDSYRDLARLPPPVPAPVDLAATLADLAQLFAVRWPAVALTLHMPAGPVVANADADQIAQAVWAVLQNAAEAAGAVTLAVEHRRTMVALTITDDGPGVPADRAEAIFRPFFTTKRDGSGIGLALARQVLRGHGGDLTLIPGDGGARFTATLPAA